MNRTHWLFLAAGFTYGFYFAYLWLTILRCLLLGKIAINKPRQCIKKQRIAWPTKIHTVKTHAWTWELDHKEGWAPEKWCFRTVVLEKTLESPLDCKEIKLVHPKGNQPWIFIEGLMLKLKLQCFDQQIQRADSLGKTLMLGKTEDKRSGQQRRWHHWFNRH